ncbi:MAG TPA: phage tail protein [Jatrophihabitantaceae bacterium]|jgi:phage tail-like protein
MPQHKSPALSLRFDVRIDGVQVATFTGCAGLDAQYEAFEWQEGGDNGTVVRLPGRLSYGTVKLSRAVDSDSGALAAWFTEQQRSPKRREVTIGLYDENRARITSWKLAGAWPVRYTGPTLSTTAAGAVAVEVLELAHQGFAT